jgi:hypothetical protein
VLNARFAVSAASATHVSGLLLVTVWVFESCGGAQRAIGGEACSDMLRLRLCVVGQRWRCKSRCCTCICCHLCGLQKCSAVECSVAELGHGRVSGCLLFAVFFGAGGEGGGAQRALRGECPAAALFRLSLSVVGKAVAVSKPVLHLYPLPPVRAAQMQHCWMWLEERVEVLNARFAVRATTKLFSLYLLGPF